MAIAWCPRCRSEYREGFTECADCSVALVEELPPEPDVSRKPKVTLHFSAGSDPVELVNVSAVEAELAAARLNAVGIPAEVLGVPMVGEMVAVQFSQGSRVMVPRADLAAARAAVADLFDGGETPDAIDGEGLAAQAEAATGWSDPDTGAVV